MWVVLLWGFINAIMSNRNQIFHISFKALQHFEYYTRNSVAVAGFPSNYVAI